MTEEDWIDDFRGRGRTTAFDIPGPIESQQGNLNSGRTPTGLQIRKTNKFTSLFNQIERMVLRGGRLAYLYSYTPPCKGENHIEV